MVEKEAMPVSFTMFFTPAMLALVILAAVLLVQSIRRQNAGLLCCALGLLALTGLCVSIVMEFITRM